MAHIARRPRRLPFNPRNPDGSFKSFDQICRAIMTVREYGQMLALKRRAE
jgi:hypothetical protein